MRCAIYYIPPPEHPLCAKAGQWLRRDPYTGAAIVGRVAGLDEAWHAQLTASPRRYGFHATVKAPFRLDQSWTVEDVASALDEFALRADAFELPLRINRIGSFFAYTPVAQPPRLTALAEDVVTAFDPFRAPLNDADLARRNMDGLTETQREHVMRWGYPYVFDQFKFHMTLTGPVEPEDQGDVEHALRAHFGAEAEDVLFTQLALAVEPVDQSPFIIHSVHRFASAREQLRA